MVVEINGYEFKLLRNCKKARELLENYKNKTVKEERLQQEQIQNYDFERGDVKY